jgi:hypothetical protein
MSVEYDGREWLGFIIDPLMLKSLFASRCGISARIFYFPSRIGSGKMRRLSGGSSLTTHRLISMYSWP